MDKTSKKVLDFFVSQPNPEKNLHYKEIKAAETKDFFLKSIAVPIIVSVLTAGIITSVGYIWGQRALIAGMITNSVSDAPTTEPIQQDTQ